MNFLYCLVSIIMILNVNRKIIKNIKKSEELILNELKKFNPKNWNVIVISSNRRPNWVPSSQKTYKVDGQHMYYHHAYSLYAVEKKWKNIKSVIMEDPADNNKKIRLSISSFMSSFSTITTCCPLEWFLSVAPMPVPFFGT